MWPTHISFTSPPYLTMPSLHIPLLLFILVAAGKNTVNIRKILPIAPPGSPAPARWPSTMVVESLEGSRQITVLTVPEEVREVVRRVRELQEGINSWFRERMQGATQEERGKVKEALMDKVWRRVMAETTSSQPEIPIVIEATVGNRRVRVGTLPREVRELVRSLRELKRSINTWVGERPAEARAEVEEVRRLVGRLVARRIMEELGEVESSDG